MAEFVVFDDDGEHSLTELVSPDDPVTNNQPLESWRLGHANVFRATGSSGMVTAAAAAFCAFFDLVVFAGSFCWAGMVGKSVGTFMLLVADKSVLGVELHYTGVNNRAHYNRR